MQAVAQCFEDLRVAYDWGVADVARELKVHYETVRRLKEGKIKDPSFAMVAGLHQLAGRSMDPLIGLKPTLGIPMAMEDADEQLILEAAKIALARRNAQAHGVPVAEPAGEMTMRPTPEQDAEGRLWEQRSDTLDQAEDEAAKFLKDDKAQPAVQTGRGKRTGTK